ncbi:trypsin-like serine protease [Haloferula sp.]|uniref:trypsin-like serine protease n=1 Tax=Haloferula sp. TaxID=2497595 RepID=UPI00329FFF1A
MLPFSRRFVVTAFAILPTLSVQAFEIRSYNATDHKRFDNFPSSPTPNPDLVVGDMDLSGIGWQSNSADIQYALVSRQHVVFATHFASVLGGSAIRFLNSSDQIVSRTGPTLTTIQDGGTSSDLTLITLSSPIDLDQGVSPLPYFNIVSGDHDGLTIGITGKRDEGSGNKFQVIGQDTIDNVEGSSRLVDFGSSGMLNSRYMLFEYRKFSGSPDEGRFEVGDSGSPTFVIDNGMAALVGIHSYVGETNVKYLNYDVFVPHYISELDAEMASLGYRMRPFNFSSTTLSGSSSVVETTPRQALPLTLEFAIGNTGANLTGNLEVEFSFPAGQEPDSVSAAGWVVYGSGTKWTLRKATLASAANETLTASWTAAPIVASVTPTITWRSDTVLDQDIAPSISLSPSYAAWASDLAEGELTDDPDKDSLINQIEYALGGDPENGSAVLPNGEPLLPTISVSGGLVTYCHPERDDKAARGLSYDPEWSDELSDVSFSTTPPAGLNSSSAAYVPDVPGFVKRTITWPVDAPRQFIRLGISLSE